MKFQYGTPTEPGRYDCVFDNKSRSTYDIVEILESGKCIAKGTRGFEPVRLRTITQYLGPFPDPLPKREALKPFRRFNVTDLNGRKGTGAYDPNAAGEYMCYFISWAGEECFARYRRNESASFQFDWIDEEPHD